MSEQHVCAVCGDPALVIHPFDTRWYSGEEFGAVLLCGEHWYFQGWSAGTNSEMLTAIRARRQQTKQAEQTKRDARADEPDLELSKVRARRQQTETPLELARRLLPGWIDGPHRKGSAKIVAPDWITHSFYDWVLIDQDTTLEFVRGQCETALARYRERQKQAGPCRNCKAMLTKSQAVFVGAALFCVYCHQRARTSKGTLESGAGIKNADIDAQHGEDGDAWYRPGAESDV